MLPCTAGWLLAASHQAVSFGSSADKEREGQRDYGHSLVAICSTARGCERCSSPRPTDVFAVRVGCCTGTQDIHLSCLMSTPSAGS
jgi:hypothetical protein